MTFYIKLKMSTSWYHYKNFYYNIIKKNCLEVVSAGCNLRSHENRHGTTIRKLLKYFILNQTSGPNK